MTSQSNKYSVTGHVTEYKLVPGAATLARPPAVPWPAARAVADRRRRLAKSFSRLRGGTGIDALLVTEPHNVRYLTGFTGEDSALLVAGPSVAGRNRGSIFLTDGRFTTQAQEEVRTQGSRIPIITRRKGMMDTALRVAAKLGIDRLGVESQNLTLAGFRRLEKLAKKISLVETADLVENLRLVKDRGEVALILASVGVAEAAFRSIRPLVKPGVTEKRLAAALAAAIVDHGGEDARTQGSPFPLIVLAGERTALPHGHPSDRQIRAGEPVLFDWGAAVGGYASDLTRVLFVHRMSAHQRHLYEAVLDAQREALRRIRPGALAGKLDEVARTRLNKSGLGRFFTHSLGHGVGLQVHESPRVSAGSGQRLRPGMVFTVEPGVYLPGRIGIRIEDTVLVTRSGGRVMGSVPKKPDDVIVRG